MEMLSEDTVEGWLEGYILSGRRGLINSYEPFIHIIDSMLIIIFSEKQSEKRACSPARSCRRNESAVLGDLSKQLETMNLHLR
jgi:phosphoketolase